MRGHYREMQAAAEQCLAHSRLAGNARRERSATGRLGGALEFGPTPAPEAIRRCERILTEARSEAIGHHMIATLAILLSMRGEHDRAYALLEHKHEIGREHGIPQPERHTGVWHYGRIATNEGDWPTAIWAYRLTVEDNLRLGEIGPASTNLGNLAECLAHVGELDEADQLVSQAAKFGSDDVVDTQRLVSSARVIIASKRGDHHKALRHASKALDVVNTTDNLNNQADVHLDHAEIHARRGDPAAANASAQQALALLRAKQSLVGEARAQAVTDGLRRAPA